MMNVINIQFNGWNTIVISINIIAFAIAIALLFIIILGLKKASFFLGCYSVNIDEASLGIGNNSVTVKFNKQDQEIAYKLWVELTTRKIALLYDKENDGPKVGKMPKYNDLDSFDFRDLSDETNKTREALKESINKTFDRMLEKIDRIGIDITHDKQKISSMMKEISDGTRKDYKEIEMEKAKYNAQTMNALLEANKNRGRGGFGMMPIGSI